MLTVEQRKELYSTYNPDDQVMAVVAESGLSIIGNEITGSGKNALLDATVEASSAEDYEGKPFIFVPSRKTRVLRTKDGEIEGLHQVTVTLDEADREIVRRKYVEWELMRKGEAIYGTHVQELKEAIKSGRRPIKDVEPRGQANVARYNPGVRFVYPLPDLDPFVDPESGQEYDTVWEGLTLKREGMVGHNFHEAVVSKHNSPESKKDLSKRLEVAGGQITLLRNLGFDNHANYLYVVNKYGVHGLKEAARVCLAFFDGELDSDGASLSFPAVSPRQASSILMRVSAIADSGLQPL